LTASALVVGLGIPATAQGRMTLTCYDGERGAVAEYDGAAQVVSDPTCDFDAQGDGICTFAFPCRAGFPCPPCCGEARHVRVGHGKRYRKATRLLCRQPQACAS